MWKVELLLTSNLNSLVHLFLSIVIINLNIGRIQEPVERMAIAPNGQFVACFCRQNGLLVVMSSSFNAKFLDYETNSSAPPINMVWCGEDCVLLHWSGFILMVGPEGNWIDFHYSEPFFLGD